MSSHPYLRRARRSHAPTLRSPFGERGDPIHLCRDAVPTLPMESISGWGHLKVTRAARGAAPTQGKHSPDTPYSILSAYFCTFAQAVGRFALLHLGRRAVPTLPRCLFLFNRASGPPGLFRRCIPCPRVNLSTGQLIVSPCPHAHFPPNSHPCPASWPSPASCCSP
jgi:hypothetical protein